MKRFLQNGIVIFPHLLLMATFSPITLINLLFNTSSGFLFQFEARIIYYFRA